MIMMVLIVISYCTNNEHSMNALSLPLSCSLHLSLFLSLSLSPSLSLSLSLPSARFPLMQNRCTICWHQNVQEPPQPYEKAGKCLA